VDGVGGVFSEISSGVVLGEVCWYINMCELLVDYCNIASCCCLSQVVIMRAWAGCWLSLPRSFFSPWCSKVGAKPGWVDMSPSVIVQVSNVLYSTSIFGLVYYVSRTVVLFFTYGNLFLVLRSFL